MKKIGIIGGLGALASHYFMGRFLHHFRQLHPVNDDDDFPEICYHSLSSKVMDDKGQMKDNFPQLIIEHARVMEKQGVQAIVIICNTAHVHYQRIQQALNIPVINMIDVTAHYLQEKQIKSIAILCSEFSEKQHLHQKVFEQYNVQTVYPVEQRSNINELIDISLKGKNGYHHEKLLNDIAKPYAYTLLGCTELSLIASDLQPGIIDATEILAEYLAFQCA